MPAITVSDDVTFHYNDSGPVHQSTEDSYTTIIIVHGHSFHSGVFARILPFATLHGVRIICVSRRGYLGSTPYSLEEKEMIEGSVVEQHSTFLHTQGRLLAFFIDSMIQRYALPESGGIALLGWSIGNTFTMAILAALCALPPDTKGRLQRYLHTYICWDAPSVAFGIPFQAGSYHPFSDSSLMPQERSAAFATWLSGYFQHGDLSTKDFTQLKQRDFDTQVRKPTIATMTTRDIESVFDGISGSEFDNPLISQGRFESALQTLTYESLFNPEIRKEWARLKICFAYAECTIWVVIFAMWKLEDRARQSGIDYEFVTGANHFMMWDEPERFVTFVKKIISSLNAPI